MLPWDALQYWTSSVGAGVDPAVPPSSMTAFCIHRKFKLPLPVLTQSACPRSRSMCHGMPPAPDGAARMPCRTGRQQVGREGWIRRDRGGVF